MDKGIIKALAGIVGEDSVSQDKSVLRTYIRHDGFAEEILPYCVVWPSDAKEVLAIVELANQIHFSISPVSSGGPRMRGASSPKVEKTVTMDLSRMKSIIRVDGKNKVAMIEPGVTYDELIPKLKEAGLRPLMSLLPKANKSVLASCLDRESITIPRFHWDSSDPLLCTETVFGTGEMLRTGSASGPGSLEEQWASGQAQKNPMGPSQFDPFRLVQGSQGTIGIVTWITMKCEVAPEVHRVYLAGSETLESLQKFNYTLLRRRLADEHFVLNARCLSAMLGKDTSDSLPEWILVVGLSGHGPLAQEEFDYRLGDTNDIALETGVSLETTIGSVTGEAVLSLLNTPSTEPYWKLAPYGGCREVYFTSTLDMIESLYGLFLDEAEAAGIGRSRIGAYVQPTVQGVNTNCYFDIYYNPKVEEDIVNMEKLEAAGTERLMDAGAFFSRPPVTIRESVFSRSSPEVLNAMNRVKRIFDPNNVLSPGNLCFEEVFK